MAEMNFQSHAGEASVRKGSTMFNTSILQSKFKIPKPRKNYVVRRELYQILDQVPDYKVILIQGEAGSGKTTLLSSYISDRKLELVR